MSENRYVTEESLIRFQGFLQQEERSAGTIEKYMRDVKNFAAWIEDQSSVPSGLSLIHISMKMENEICATGDGTVDKIVAAKGSSVNSGDVLVTLK